MKRTVVSFMMAVCLGLPVFAEAKEHGGKEHGGAPLKEHGGTAERQDAGGTIPPGLSQQGKTPKGLEKQGKTPEGWKRGKKKGWKKGRPSGPKPAQ